MTSERPKTKEFDEIVRADSFQFATEAANVANAEELLRLSRTTVQRWVKAAYLSHEKRYQCEFYDALQAAYPFRRNDEPPREALGDPIYWPTMDDRMSLL